MNTYIVEIATLDGDNKYLDIRAASDKKASAQAMKLVAKRRWSSDWYVQTVTQV